MPAVPAKSAHDIRRTVATKLYRNTHDIEFVRKFLGHSDVQTTWSYIVDIDAEKEDRERTVEALKDLGLDSDGKITPFRKALVVGLPTLQMHSDTQVTHFFRA